MSQFTLPKESRLQRKEEFDHVFSVRSSVADARLVVYGARNSLGRTRLGIVVSRRLGSAVVRNRFKRIVREAFRLSQHDLPASIDLVVLPRAGGDLQLHTVRSSLQELAKRVARKLQNS